jgi:hypothetical protein
VMLKAKLSPVTCVAAWPVSSCAAAPVALYDDGLLSCSHPCLSCERHTTWQACSLMIACRQQCNSQY